MGSCSSGRLLFSFLFFLSGVIPRCRSRCRCEKKNNLPITLPQMDLLHSSLTFLHAHKLAVGLGLAAAWGLYALSLLYTVTSASQPRKKTSCTPMVTSSVDRKSVV